MNLLEQGRKKLYALQPNTHWAAELWITECFGSGNHFKINEVYRTQDRQNYLIAHGRTEEDIWQLAIDGWISSENAREAVKKLRVNPRLSKRNISTWTDRSFHKQRLACDIQVVSGSLGAISKIAAKYSIFNPLAGDRGHFQFNKVPARPLTLNGEARLKRARRALSRINNWIKKTTGRVREAYKRKKERLLKRI